MRAERLRQIRKWSEHPEDLTLLGPSAVDVERLLNERADLLSVACKALDALRVTVPWAVGRPAEENAVVMALVAAIGKARAR